MPPLSTPNPSMIQTYLSTTSSLFPSLRLPTRPSRIYSLKPHHLSLILSGVKTAIITWPVHDIDTSNPVPKINDISILLDKDECETGGDGGDVEGAISLSEWRKRRGEEFLGRQTEECRWSDEESVLCEWFELVYPVVGVKETERNGGLEESG
ncbi:hypothetical protein ABW19_dt0207127 [Dactylella cylindrospora]|nr:hypothetical protein ABW19_dt0207127 [Dactylella cylindrospora]